MSYYCHLTTSSNRPMPGFTSDDQVEGRKPGLPSISVYQTVVKADQLHWAFEGARWLALSLFLPACVRWHSQLGQASGQLQCETNLWEQVWLHAVLLSGFPPHSPGCWNIYGENSLMSWKKEIMSYKTADCHKVLCSIGQLEFLPLTCRDKLSLSGTEMTPVQDFTCLMKWE